MLRRLGALAAPLVVLAAFGCSTYTPGWVVGRNVIDSSRPVKAGDYEVVGPVEGSCWCGVFYLLFIPIHFGGNDPARDARDDALGDDRVHMALIDATMDNTMALIPAAPILGATLTVTHVRGTAVRLRDEVAPVATKTETHRKK